MSEPLRIALVAEGVTDYVVFKAAVEHLIDQRSHDFTLLQPEGSVAFVGAGNAGILGGGWKGVYKWCQQNAEDTFLLNVLFRTYDVLILHLDADVGENPNEKDWPAGLPCIKPCPPVSEKTDALRAVVLGWLGLTEAPDNIVFCIPSKSTEAWMMWLFFPDDREMERQNWECYPDPASRLSQQRKAQRFRKNQADYQARFATICQRWPELSAALSEARRFEDDFLVALSKP